MLAKKKLRMGRGDREASFLQLEYEVDELGLAGGVARDP